MGLPNNIHVLTVYNELLESSYIIELEEAGSKGSITDVSPPHPA